MKAIHLRSASLLGAGIPPAAVNLHAQMLDPSQQQQLLLRADISAGRAQAPRAALPQTTEAALTQQLDAWAPAQSPFAVERFATASPSTASAYQTAQR